MGNFNLVCHHILRSLGFGVTEPQLMTCHLTVYGNKMNSREIVVYRNIGVKC